MRWFAYLSPPAARDDAVRAENEKGQAVKPDLFDDD